VQPVEVTADPCVEDEMSFGAGDRSTLDFVTDFKVFKIDGRNSDHALSFEATTVSCACGLSADGPVGYTKEQIFVTFRTG
jgi:hypothetical protein